MQTLRTPDDRFTRLPDFDYRPHYTQLPDQDGGFVRMAWVEDVLALRAATLVGQDWGGLIGLRLVAERPDRFARVVAANTGLPTGDHPMPEIWHRFREAIQTAPEIDVGRFVQAGCRRRMSD